MKTIIQNYFDNQIFSLEIINGNKIFREVAVFNENGERLQFFIRNRKCGCNIRTEFILKSFSEDLPYISEKEIEDIEFSTKTFPDETIICSKDFLQEVANSNISEEQKNIYNKLSYMLLKEMSKYKRFPAKGFKPFFEKLKDIKV